MANGEMKMEFIAKRITRNYCQTINSTPDKIFPLICPVREAEWLEDWDCKMVYSKTGYAEEGAVFTTPYDGEDDTIWIITIRDPIKYKVEFVRVTPSSRVSILNVNIREKDIKSSYVDITYTYTSITCEGNKFIDEYTEEVFLKMVKHWENSVNYFLETGKKLSKNN
jgi:hypothetical protein